MTNIELLLAKSFESNMVNTLGKNCTIKIKNRLIEKFGIGLSQAMVDFDKYEDVLREFFGNGADGMIQNILKHICILEKHNQNTLELKNESFKELILESYDDSIKRDILSSVTHVSMTISEMAGIVSNPPNNILVKIKELIADGLLIPVNEKLDKTSYKTIVNKIEIKIQHNKLDVSIMVNENLASSMLLKYLI